MGQEYFLNKPIQFIYGRNILLISLFKGIESLEDSNIFIENSISPLRVNWCVPKTWVLQVLSRWIVVGESGLKQMYFPLNTSPCCSLCVCLLNVSVSSKPDHPPGDPRDLHILTARGIRFLPNFLCLGGRGFELEKFPTVLKEKCSNFSVCEIEGSLKSRRSCALFHINFCKNCRCLLYL